MKVSVILPAAGLGTRMKSGAAEKTGTSRKQFMLLDGVPILIHTIRKFVSCAAVSEVIVACRADDIEWVKDVIAHENPVKPVRVVEGGATRQHSVENGLAAVSPDAEIVAVHDAVRPFIDPSVIERLIEEAATCGAAIAGIIPVDTVKQVHGKKIRGTLNRDRLVLAQTPQVFRIDLLRRAYARANEDDFAGTDESSLVERLDEVEVSVVSGSDRNIKITKPADMELARLYLSQEKAERAG